MFRTAPVEDDAHSRGFALLSFYDSSIDSKIWKNFLETSRKASGAYFYAMLIEDERGYAHALLATRPEADLHHGHVLRVKALACSGVPGRMLHEAIITAAEARAREMGCAGLVLEVAEIGGAAPPSLERSVRGAGFDRIGACYYRALPVS